MKNSFPDLPPPVAAHVQKQLIKTDWSSLLSDLRNLCADCPAERDENICISCPLEGIAVDAATLTLKARIAGLQHKAVKKNAKHNI